jgi:hypothetical protein
MTANSTPHNDGSVNPDNSEVQAAVTGAAASSSSVASVSQPAGGARAVEGDEEPCPPVTGTALEAEDRALLRAEDERLRRLAQAQFRERKRRYNWPWYDADTGYPWLQRLLSASSYPFSDEECAKLYWQVEEEFAELRRKQLERKQGQEKEG